MGAGVAAQAKDWCSLARREEERVAELRRRRATQPEGARTSLSGDPRPRHGTKRKRGRLMPSPGWNRVPVFLSGVCSPRPLPDSARPHPVPVPKHVPLRRPNPVRSCARAETRLPSLAGAGLFLSPRRSAARFPHQIPVPVCRRRLRSAAVPFPDRQPDPPRCCVDLQCLTVRRSRSSGFPAPPTPLCFAAWTLACSGARPTSQFPGWFVTTPDLTFTLEDLVRFLVRDSSLAHDGAAVFTSILPWGLPPLQRSQHRGSVSRAVRRLQ